MQSFTSISPYLISEERWNMKLRPSHVEPVTLRKYVAEYKQMWKLMVEFLSKFQGQVIHIDRVNSIRVAKSMIFFNILRAVAR